MNRDTQLIWEAYQPSGDDTTNPNLVIPKEYRKVKLKKEDGTEEIVYFNDKYYDMGKLGKFASIARMTEKGLSHGATKPGDTIEELH